MSARFGRNQRRQARERIAELEFKLSMESTYHLFDGAGDPIDGLVTHYSVTTDGAAYDVARVSATLEMTMGAYADICTQHSTQQRVRFQGRSYLIQSVGVFGDRLTVELEGVA